MIGLTRQGHADRPQGWAISVLLLFGDGHEPAHVHVERDDRLAKFWLAPVRLDRSGRFSRTELRDIGRLVDGHAAELLEAWNDYFGQ